MDLTVGDIISTQTINAGEFQGITKEVLAGLDMEMAKVYESAKDITHYLPLKELEKAEKLPSKEYFEKSLKHFKKLTTEDLPDIQASDRYEYFKTQVETKGLKTFMEVFKFLLLLDSTKSLNIHEKKFLNKMKAKFTTDTELILGWDKLETRKYIKIQ